MAGRNRRERFVHETTAWQVAFKLKPLRCDPKLKAYGKVRPGIAVPIQGFTCVVNHEVVVINEFRNADAIQQDLEGMKRGGGNDANHLGFTNVSAVVGENWIASAQAPATTRKMLKLLPGTFVQICG